MLWRMPGKCLRRYVSRRGRSAKIWSLPSHSGAGVCRSGWTLVAIARGKCSAPVERDRHTGRAIALWASRLDDPNQDCDAVWGAITRISRRLDQPRWTSGRTACEGVRASSRWCWSSQRARSSQSLTPGKAGRRRMHQETDKQTVMRHCLCIFVFRNMTCS